MDVAIDQARKKEQAGNVDDRRPRAHRWTVGQFADVIAVYGNVGAGDSSLTNVHDLGAYQPGCFRSFFHGQAVYAGPRQGR
jgi:hypothetical protein